MPKARLIKVGFHFTKELFMKKYILICCLVGIMLIIGCGNKAVTAVSVDSLRQEVSISTDTVATKTSTKVPDDLPTSTVAGNTSPIVEADETQQTTEASTAMLPAPTMEKLLQTALLPVGNTMYIWGGGWNEEDTGAGVGATTIGLHPKWAAFTALQDENYNYKNHRYEILNGLDCSGYVGWVVYNLFESENNRDGYVFKSTDIATEYSNMGWGELLENPDSFFPGDIVSIKGHVWISLGMCADESTLLVHASPPGVSICGTALQDGTKSQAVTLAEQYMETHYPKWQEKYPDREVGTTYTQNTTVMRWSEELLPDTAEWQTLSAEEILQKLLD